MKKVFLSLLLILFIGVGYLIFNATSFSPLKNYDFQRIFKGQKISFEKVCSKDFLKASFHGELFEIYKFRIKGATIDRNYPNINNWEREEITTESIISKWKNCPLDSQALELYDFTLTANDFDKIKCFESFNKDLLNPTNFYSYIHNNELGQYFFLYSINRQELYYLRRRGF